MSGVTSRAPGVPLLLMRGGTSKGAFVLANDLPDDPAERDDLLLRLMGSPDPRQIDGLGGGHPLTTKVAVVRPCPDDRADVAYLFLQPSVDEPLVADRQNCGNMLAAVGPFAVERSLVSVADDATEASVRILMENTDSIAVATFPVADGLPVYDGDLAISGVPGTAAPIRLDFEDVAGSSCGALFPTGNLVDTVAGVAVTLVDHGMPVALIRSDALGIDGDEAPADLEANATLRSTLEAIRIAAGPLMGLGDVADTTVPKLTIVSAPSGSGSLATRTFIPHRCHDAIGVLGALSVAVAAEVPGTVAHDLVARTAIDAAGGTLTLEHPTGTFAAAITVTTATDGQIEIDRAGIVRTARALMDGVARPRQAP